MKFKKKILTVNLLLITLFLSSFRDTSAIITGDFDSDGDLILDNSNSHLLGAKTSSAPLSTRVNHIINHGLIANKPKNEENSEINFLQMKTKNKTNLTSKLKNKLKNRNKSKQNAKDQAAGNEEIDEPSKPEKFQPYTKTPPSLVNSQPYQKKLEEFKQNVQNYLQANKTFRTGSQEGYIEKFHKIKYVQPGQDIFLGFLKYMSNTAQNIQQKVMKDKSNTDPLKYQGST